MFSPKGCQFHGKTDDHGRFEKPLSWFLIRQIVALWPLDFWCIMVNSPNEAQPHSYGHLLVITGYKWDYTFYKWGYKYL